MPFPDFEFFGEVTSRKVKEYLEQGMGLFKVFIGKQAVIRCFVAGGPGYGHHSASVNIVRRICDSSAVNPLGCDYTGTVEIFVNIDEDIPKVLELIPELRNQATGGRLNKATVTIKVLDDAPPATDVDFGFTGACDYINNNEVLGFLEASFLPLRTKCFLMLQPYKWKVKKFATRGLSPGNLLFYRKPVSGTVNVYALNLDTGIEQLCRSGSSYPYTFIQRFDMFPPLYVAERSFFTPIPDLTTQDWDTIAANLSANGKTLLKILQILTIKENLDEYSIVPIYGINYPAETAFREPVSERLSLALASFQTALRSGAAGKIKPPIIINFSPYIPGTNQEMTLAKVLSIANGGRTTYDNFLQQLLQSRIAGPKAGEFVERAVQRANARFRSFHAQGMDFIKIINYTDIGTSIYSLLIWLSDNPHRVLMIQADRVPSIVFNYVMKVAGLLPVFEGQNTAVPAIMTGKPYLHTLRVGYIGTENNYPPGNVGEKSAGTVIRTMQNIANQIQGDLNFWPLAVDEAPSKIMADFITTFTDNTDITKYFGSVQEYFQKPINDKIVIGTSVFANYYPTLFPGQQVERPAGELPPLEQLYNEIKAEIDSTSMVDLLGTILTTGGIHDYFADVLTPYGGKLIIDQANVEAHRDESNQIDTVTLTGKTDAYGVLANSTFVFNMRMDDIACAADFVAKDNWSLNGIPWIVFEAPTFHVLVANGGLPPSGTISVMLQSTDLTLSLTLPDSNGLATCSGTFTKPASISTFLGFVGGINLETLVPEPIQKLANVGVKSIQFTYSSKLGIIESIAVEIGSPDKWQLLDRLAVDNAGVLITILSPGDLNNRKTSVTVSGDLVIGTEANSPRISVSAQVPGLRLSGQLDSPELPLNNLLQVFWPGASPSWPGGNEPAITELSLSYNSNGSEYMVDTTLELNWPIVVAGRTILTIEYISLSLSGGDGWSTGSLSGSVIILPDGANVGLLLTAMYLGNGAGWRFIAQQTSGKVPLLALLKQYLGWDTTFEIYVDGLGLEIETATNSWLFTGKTADPVLIPGIDLSLYLNLKLGYNGGTQSFGGRETISGKAEVPVLLPDNHLVSLASILQTVPATGYFGTGQADIIWQNIDLTVYYDFAPGYQSFGIKWGQLEGKITQSGTPPKTTATLRFTQSTTIGSMVETMVSWATGSKFSLGAPWNILNSVALNNLVLTFNLTDKQVGLEIALNPIAIGLFGINIATITGFKLTYQSDQPDPNQNGVQVQLLGDFKWQQDPRKPLGWDASKPETTPAPPAQGNKYIDLRMLAMGQHVDVKGLAGATSIAQAISIMEKLPATPKGQLPPVALNANNGWLVGMDLGLLRISQDPPPKSRLPLDAGQGVLALPSDYVFNLQIVFSDPNLYGLRIALNGDAAKVFKGLQFEVMYRQVSQSVGVYQSEITLPDVMRYIRLGQFNIVLPVFGIQVYTNGDFQVDLGFPWNANFSRSFTLQTIIFVPVPIPVMGSIGLYFAKLSSATTTKVPASKKGIFNPVVAFGVGFQIGLGYEFNMGILSAGFSLTVAAIIEGVIAKWNPYLPAPAGQRDRIETDYYFSIRGTVGLIGRLYGTVDFAIIKASVDIEIIITAQFYFAPYEPIELALTASVRASASIKILFITISFSFSLRIQHHLTLPAVGGTAPWADGTEKRSLAQSRRLERAGMAVRLLQHKLLAAAPVLHWDNLLPAGSPVELPVYLMLGLTAARDENEKTPTLAGQQACGVAVMMMESVKAPQDDLLSCRLKAADQATDSAFEKVAKQVFRWMFAALQTQPLTEKEVDQSVVTLEQLEILLNYLSAPNNDIPIPEKDINTFMERQFSVVVHGPDAAANSTEINATYFPVLPSVGFSMERPGEPEPLAYTYAAYNATSTDYLTALRVYFNEIAVNVGTREKAGYKNFSLSDDNGPSVGSFVFSDYYALLAKQMLQMAVNSLKTYVYPIQPEQLTEDIVKWVNQTGGLTNGQEYTLEKLFTDNKTHDVSAESVITIAGTPYIIQTGDTFSAIASLAIYAAGFTAQSLARQNATTAGIVKAGSEINYTGKPPYSTLPQQTLENIATALEVNVDELLQYSNILTLKDLLVPASTLWLPEFNYKAKEKDKLNEIATTFGVTLEQLANIPANGKIKDLFDAKDNPDLNIVQLPQFNVAALLQEIQYTQGLQHLAGLTSRYYMAGLRLPTKGLSPKYPGMWVTGDKDDYSLPENAGLFALSGQQFPVPVLSTGQSLTLTFTNNGCKWISFDKQATLSISITPESLQYKEAVALTAFATKNYLDVGLTQLGTPELFSIEANTYTFNSDINWASPSYISMPYPGNTGEPQQLRLWKIPDSLLNLPDLAVHKINPLLNIQLGTYDEAAQKMKYSSFSNYGWGTRIDFTIRKISPVPESPTTATTYEVAGANGFNTLLLEKLVDQIGDNDSLINSLHLAFTQSSDETAGGGIQTDNPDQLTIGLAQVNLTTVTAPNVSAMNNDGQPAAAQHLIAPTQFIRLLWEASITSQGGYYLYYYNDKSNAGLPDRIFDNQGNAQLSLIVLFSGVQRNELCSYMNVLATARAVDFSSHTLFARTLMQDLQITADNQTSLAGIVRDYFADADQIAAKNKDIPLRTGAVLSLRGGVYEVRDQAPGWKLNDIAAYFEVTPESVKSANPQITNWDSTLPVFTAIYLPDHTMVVGTSKGGTNIGNIARYYSISVSGIALANRDVTGIFEPGKTISFTSGPLTNQSTIKQGEMAVKAVRKVAPPVPDNPADKDFALNFLQNNFSLLGYRISENAFFDNSNLSLPLCPVIPGTTSDDDSKFLLPPVLGVDDQWQYTNSLAYTSVVKTMQQATPGLPAPENDPYQGLGSLLQIRYSWQDVYGNSLLTTLDNLQDGNNLNNFPILIKYYDTLVGLSRWPSISSNWQVPGISGQPALHLILNFDAAAYDGLLIVKADDNNTLTAVFTVALDETSATDAANYSLSDGIQIVSISLNTDKKSVQIKVSDLVPGVDISLQVKNIFNQEKSKSYTGAATFSTNPAISPTSTIMTKAAGDKVLYEQIWYQLNDRNGIKMMVNTSLVPGTDFILDTTQTTALVQNWLAAIYQYIDNRAAGKDTTVIPDLQHVVMFNINPANIATKDTFKLTLDFTIRRNRLLADSTDDSILTATTTIAPQSDLSASNGNTYTKFVTDFETAFSGSLELRIAAGVDRFDSIVTADSTLWVVRLDATNTGTAPALGFEINKQEEPKLFAPRPVANQLISRTGVPICTFDPKTGLDCKGGIHKDFIDVDINLWCKQVFENFDELLSPAFVTCIQIVDFRTKNENPQAPSFFDLLISQKEQLADIVKELMVPVFEDQVTIDPTDIREDFKQALLVKLSNAYSVQSGLQFSANVYHNNLEAPAYLYGNVIQKDDGGTRASQNIQLTAPKISLAPDKQAGVRFLMSAPQMIKGQQGEVLSVLDLDLSYTASAIEHQIGELPGIKDYKASSWLQFFSKDSSILSARSLSDKAVQVPLPLNVFPAAPGMNKQTGQLSVNNSDDALSDLLDWDYLFSYSQPFHYPQDILHFSVQFNLVLRDTSDVAGLEDAFADIAQFITVMPEINEALGTLSAVTMSSDTPAITAAATVLTAYTTMVGNIITRAKVTGLQVQQQDMRAVASADGPYAFVVKEGNATIDGQEGVLLVSVGLTAEVQAAIGIPVVTIDDYETVSHTPCETGFYCYYYKHIKDGSLLPASIGQTIAKRTVVLKKLNILARQDAGVGVYMDRNADLVPGKPTNHAFVYTTGNVEFPNYYYPNFVRNEPINIATIPTGQPVVAPLQTHLNNLFDALLKKNQQGKLSFNVVVAYDYQVNLPGNTIQLPVMMQPARTFDLGAHPDKAPEGMIDNWVKVISDWLKTNDPNKANAAFNFNLTIFSNLTDEPKPLIQLTRLYLKLADIG
ncbi:hypothetical protein [Chitinophaga varians]|uniref:hypothetical protein n=1 Tax=Chitinophaga varians TaxID=2202339 RepID=UPI00165F2BFC|nr:hypothetical protein [Chitinophaga varians]MBC9909724.1 hypothetical protein [Chitinophaga varians]